MANITYSISSYRLFEAITNLSTSSCWEEAKREWYLAYIEIADDDEVAKNKYQCACGHPRIKELCYIRNKVNGNKVLVGNCCVKKFMEFESNKLFQAMKKEKPNPALIEYAYDKGIITEWEHDFLLSTVRKRKLSAKQQAVFNRLKKTILEAVKSH